MAGMGGRDDLRGLSWWQLVTKCFFGGWQLLK